MFEFIINNHRWTIEERSQDEIKKDFSNHCDTATSVGKYYGVTWQDTQTILLDKDLHEEAKKTTLIHELTHCYICSFITHTDKTYTDEDVADIVANSHDFINEIIGKYFKAENEK